MWVNAGGVYWLRGFVYEWRGEIDRGVGVDEGSLCREFYMN